MKTFRLVLHIIYVSMLVLVELCFIGLIAASVGLFLFDSHRHMAPVSWIVTAVVSAIGFVVILLCLLSAQKQYRSR